MSDEGSISHTDENEAMKAFVAYMQQRDQAMEGMVAAINAEFGCELRLTCEACPVQLEGTIDGLTLYFRARWASWRLAIATDLKSAVRATGQAEAAFYHESLDKLGEFEASWLEPTQVNHAVRACLTAFRAGQTNAGHVELPVISE